MPNPCEDCAAIGDDYYENDDGEWVNACEGCPWEGEQDG